MSGKCVELLLKAQQAEAEMQRLMRAHDEIHRQIGNTANPKEKLRLKEKADALSNQLTAAMDKDDVASKRYSDCMRDS